MSDKKPVRPRAIAEILSKPLQERDQILAEGLALLLEHVEALHLSVDALEGAIGSRGRPILQAVMGEESAKVLILLDVVRGGWLDQPAAVRRLGYFSNHFVRGVYQRVAAINPSSFGEVHKYVESLRPEFYLDGPTDADWIFRNEIESARELAFYVDYVKEEEGHRWVTPDSNWYPTVDYPAQITADLVLAMGRVGLLTFEGLAVVAKNWRDVTMSDSTGFYEHFQIASRVMNELMGKRLHSPKATDADFSLVAERWPFPLNSIELRKIEVSGSELDTRRARAEEAFWTNELGPIDY
jgi:hypothetical protein